MLNVNLRKITQYREQEDKFSYERNGKQELRSFSLLLVANFATQTQFPNYQQLMNTLRMQKQIRSKKKADAQNELHYSLACICTAFAGGIKLWTGHQFLRYLSTRQRIHDRHSTTIVNLLDYNSAYGVSLANTINNVLI